MSAIEKTLTVEEFWAQYADARLELVRGQVDLPQGGEDATMTNAEHGKIAALLVAAMVPFVRQHNLGWVRVEAHYQLNDDTLRVPDVSFLSTAREAQITDPSRYIPFAPELVIEIISSSETHRLIRDKISDYRAAGTTIMWLVYPDTRSVEVFYLQQDRIERFSEADTLRLASVLPDFALPLHEIFAT